MCCLSIINDSGDDGDDDDDCVPDNDAAAVTTFILFLRAVWKAVPGSLQRLIDDWLTTNLRW